MANGSFGSKVGNVLGGFAGGGLPGAIANVKDPGSVGNFWNDLFGGGLFGTPEKISSLSQYTPENQEKFNDIIGNLLSQFQSGGIGGFEPIEAQARKGFREQTLPSINERLTGFGAGGGRSSGAAQILGQAGVNLDTSLAGLRSQHGMQNLKSLAMLGQQQPRIQQREEGFAEKGMEALLKILPSLLGM